MDNKNYLKDEQVKKNLEQYKNNKEEFLQNASVLNFDKKKSIHKEETKKEQLPQDEKSNNDKQELEEENSKEETTKKEITKKERKNNKLGIILCYTLTMVIMPIIVYIVFNNHITFGEGDGFSALNIIIDDNYKQIIYNIFLVSDIIISFIISIILCKEIGVKLLIAITIFFSGIIKTILVPLIYIIIFAIFFVILPLGYMAGFNMNFIHSILEHTNNLIIIITRFKLFENYISYGVYIGLATAGIIEIIMIRIKKQKNKEKNNIILTNK